MRRTAILTLGLLMLAACSRQESAERPKPGPAQAGPNAVPRVVNAPGWVNGETVRPGEVKANIACRRGEGRNMELTFDNLTSDKVGPFTVELASGGHTSKLAGRIEPSPVAGTGGARIVAPAPLVDPTIAAFIDNGTMEITLPNGQRAPATAGPEARDALRRLLAYCRGEILTPDTRAPGYTPPKS
jgi:hypothetical protein